MNSTGLPAPRSCTLESNAPVRMRRPSSGSGFELIAGRSELHHHVAQLGVELERMHAALAPDAGLLGAAERGAQVAQEPAVDPAQADLDLLRHPVRTGDVLAVDRRGKAIAVRVDLRDHFVLAVERADVATR